MATDEQAEPETAAQSAAATGWQAQKGRLDIILDRKGRAGKSATIISGFTVDDEAVLELAGLLKRSLGTGGLARGGEILIQGDRCNDVLRFLADKGLKARII
ncbi:MAG: translation initiation factor [Roseburia sp.]|nr:translation initiation factor [Roseburia sp.]